MTFFTEFLEREPFYTYSGAFTPKVPKKIVKKRANSMQHPVFRDLESLPEKGKRWWRLVAILTFASFVMLGEKDGRPIEQSSSLFPSQRLKLNSFIW